MQVRILTHPLARIKIRGQLISFSLKGSMNKWARNAKMCHGNVNEREHQKRRGS